jgi:hypothetical protein
MRVVQNLRHLSIGCRRAPAFRKRGRRFSFLGSNSPQAVTSVASPAKYAAKSEVETKAFRRSGGLINLSGRRLRWMARLNESSVGKLNVFQASSAETNGPYFAKRSSNVRCSTVASVCARCAVEVPDWDGLATAEGG